MSESFDTSSSRSMPSSSSPVYRVYRYFMSGPAAVNSQLPTSNAQRR